MKCTHDDCSTCPYPDCIKDDHMEKDRERHRIHYKNNRLKILKRMKKYQMKNKAKIQAYQKAYREKNKDIIRAKRKETYQKRKAMKCENILSK